MGCEFCDNSSTFDELKIKEYPNWIVYLHPNQYYLGRCIIRLKRHLEDFFDINDAELKEVFEITKEFRGAIKGLFGADMINYATLGNIIRHVHLHFIPRYSRKVSFSGFVFEDKRWGQNYVPYDKEFRVSKEVTISIRDNIKNKVK
ncbi:MAG: HIT family protein [Nanoarchaeota archaeon]|nr:HIT family protein [Nanoarchaeota archaeon]